ncbi:ribosome small subunit-dependent GTPase A [Paracoccus sp. ME4]|uniref:ribosome small subunit-dependent GTPase A n=1 Tax=Paracoccus sp. ME4 TaxID=3138066 RepID=UPI00398B776B
MPDAALADLGWQPFFADQCGADDAGLAPMRVASVHRTRLMAETGSGQVRLDLPLNGTTADYAVGDWVLVHPDTRVVARGLERLSLLRRRTEGAHVRQLIAANVDVLFIVTSCNDDFNPARLERYLALANEAETHPVIVLTKIDKIDDPAQWLGRARALQRDLEVVALNAKSPNAAAVLAPWCGPGRTVALVGSSGVGKSTLLNTLSGRDAQATGAIRESDAKGRHTTTARSLHPVAGGGWVIDTPGMRTLHVSDLSAGLNQLFAEITELAPLCRFRDCTHAHEPGCAVQAAVAAGTLSAERVERWRKLAEENRANTPVQTGPRGNRTTLPRGGKRR